MSKLTLLNTSENKKIIIISGKQGSGKTTLQKAIEKKFANNKTKIHVLNFADPIREIERFAVGKLEEYGVIRDIKKDGPLMQLLGTEWGRAIRQDLWVYIVKNRIELLTSKNPDFMNIFIIGDARFKNEMSAFDALKIRLECDRDTRKKRCEMWRDNETHQSEVDLDDYVGYDVVFDTAKVSKEEAIDWLSKKL